MTTEHVSVPRELAENFLRSTNVPRFRRILEEALSRATPSDECPGCGGSPASFNNPCDVCGASAPRVVPDELVQLVADDLDGIFAVEDIQEPAFLADVRRIVQRIADELANSQPSAMVPDGEVRLWDTQWMNIVNHDNSYRDWSKDDAIAHAVKMTEQAIARNFADGKLPPKKIAAAPQAEGK